MEDEVSYHWSWLCLRWKTVLNNSTWEIGKLSALVILLSTATLRSELNEKESQERCSVFLAT